MGRRLSAIALAISLLLCVATLALWIRGYWYLDGFSWKHSAGYRQLSSEQGGILLFNMRPSEADRTFGFANVFPIAVVRVFPTLA